jgi:hypothetical protein
VAGIPGTFGWHRPRTPVRMIFFGIITRQAIRRGSFASVRELVDAIGRFIDNWNEDCAPFIWTKDADTILSKAKRSPNTKDSDLKGH